VLVDGGSSIDILFCNSRTWLFSPHPRPLHQ
jgi:hypothetical protein